MTKRSGLKLKIVFSEEQGNNLLDITNQLLDAVNVYVLVKQTG